MTLPYDQNQAFGNVIDILEAIGATYAIWGGLAVVAYGEPRFTQDLDILLSPKGFATDLFIQRLQELDYHVDHIAVRKALHGGFFNVIHLHYHIKTDFYIPVEPVLITMLDSRLHLPFDTMRQAAYITPQNVVIAKLRAYENSHSTRHLEDIASIIRVQAKKLDPATLDVVAAELGVFGQWRSLWEANIN